MLPFDALPGKMNAQPSHQSVDPATLDAAVGSVPLIGDATDVFIKPNMRVLRLLERELENGSTRF